MFYFKTLLTTTTLSIPESGHNTMTVLLIAVFTVAIILLSVIIVSIGSGLMIKLKKQKGNFSK